jgi:hypothetical protein
LFEDEMFKLKNAYLFKNDKLLSSDKSFEIWKNLYENRNKLQIKTEDEYLQEQIKKAQEEENKYNKIKELKEKYNYLIARINGEHKEVSVTDIQIENNAFKLYMSILEEQKTIYQLFESLEKLEEFLKVCSDSYLKQKEVLKEVPVEFTFNKETIEMLEMLEMLAKQKNLDITKNGFLTTMVKLTLKHIDDTDFKIESDKYFNLLKQKIKEQI